MTEQVQAQARRAWDVVSVPGGDDGPPYSYTAGLARRGLHELVVFGFSADLARPVLDDLAQRLLDGERFATNVALDDVLPGMPAMMIDVPDVEAAHYLGQAKARVRGPLRALQIAWPDGDDLFPWQPGYDEAFRARQVILNPFASRGR